MKIFQPPKIEKGIPMPPPNRKNPKRKAYRSPWAAIINVMQSGDSIEVGYHESRACITQMRKLGVGFRSREKAFQSCISVRIWRE